MRLLRSAKEAAPVAPNVSSPPKFVLSFDKNIPDDVILDIFEYLFTPELLALCLVSRRLHTLILPSIYRTIELKSNQQCRLMIKSLANRPELSEYIRTLILHPNRPSPWAGLGSEKPLKESELAASIQKLASSGRLPALTTFKWEGLEAPNDDLWLSLQKYCRCLRVIGTTVGLKTHTISPDSSLFSFQGLLGFSLTTQKSLRWSPFTESQELPERLWEMLLMKCPDLEHLTLEGTCQMDQLWDIRRVLSARWPRLKSISIGGLSSHELISDDEEMAVFYKAHPALERIQFLSGMYYSRTSMFYIPNLPYLRSFTGRIQQLRQAPDLPSLRSLDFTDWFSPSARFADILRFIPHVTSLSVSVNFLDSINKNSCIGLYERLLGAFPGLSNLEISSTGPIILKDFSLALRHAPTLRSFTITRTRKLTEENMTTSAVRIANNNPHLLHFVIRDVTEWDHHDQLDGKCRFRQIGTYYLLADTESSLPRSLRIHETGVNRLGYRFTRSSTRELLRHIPTLLNDNS
ncbi:hypothetical protein BDZ94DRAFT_1247456 [Collybia nuda]|uniref:F-box domain-containing protein n=1 Tax=Collybia nuda TaxID=64659 RepID=A0A9P6CJ00_9AGAR|nr:hypothetical protein BDZ94DRAFT_1247456 [Collybia nuda]